MTTALEGDEWSAARPGRTLPSGRTRYPLYRRLGGPQGRSGQVRKISPPMGFDPRTVQPVVSHYTVWATRPTLNNVPSDIQVSKVVSHTLKPPPPAHFNLQASQLQHFLSQPLECHEVVRSFWRKTFSACMHGKCIQFIPRHFDNITAALIFYVHVTVHRDRFPYNNTN
jgi:hypothetical protein